MQQMRSFNSSKTVFKDFYSHIQQVRPSGMSMPLSKEEQIRQHHEKWRKWKNQINSKKFEPSPPKVPEPEKSTQYYAAQIMKKLELPKQPLRPSRNNQKALTLCKQCDEVMLPPRTPMTLYPCGHGMCKRCLFQDATGKIVHKSCSECGAKVVNYTENRSLMNIICADGGAYQHEVEEDVPDEEYISKAENLDNISMRVNILERERKVILAEIAQEKREMQVLEEVTAQLRVEEDKAKKQLNVLEQQLMLIEKFLRDKRDELQQIKSKMISIEEKKKVVQKALEPLQLQKEKLRFIQCANTI